jgi:hypothetical protein
LNTGQVRVDLLNSKGIPVFFRPGKYGGVRDQRK